MMPAKPEPAGPRQKEAGASCPQPNATQRSTNELAIADWLEELAVYGTARSPLDAEIAYQLSLVVENLYLVRLALERERL
jgi:hypothetical protein